MQTLLLIFTPLMIAAASVAGYWGTNVRVQAPVSSDMFANREFVKLRTTVYEDNQKQKQLDSQEIVVTKEEVDKNGGFVTANLQPALSTRLLKLAGQTQYIDICVASEVAEAYTGSLPPCEDRASIRQTTSLDDSHLKVTPSCLVPDESFLSTLMSGNVQVAREGDTCQGEKENYYTEVGARLETQTESTSDNSPGSYTDSSQEVSEKEKSPVSEPQQIAHPLYLDTSLWGNIKGSLSAQSDLQEALAHLREIADSKIGASSAKDRNQLVRSDGSYTSVIPPCAPNQKLHWNTNTNDFECITAYSAQNGLTLSSNVLKWGGELIEDTRLFDQSSRELLYFDADTGNVGVGTTAPAYKLDVQGDTNIAGKLRLNGSAGNLNEVLISQGSGAAPAWSSLSALLGSSYFTNGGNTTGALALLGTNDAYGLAFETSDTERMRIDSAGNVGIGTASPSVALDVNGKINVADTFAYQYGGTDFLSLKNGSNIALGYNAGAALTSDLSENILIGNNAGASLSSFIGSGNIVVGNGSLAANTSGYQNTAIGHVVLIDNETGTDNTGVGAGALQRNTGSFNTGIGTWALSLNYGSGNTAVGYMAGGGNPTSSGSSNVFLGYYAGYTETGSNKLYIENSSSTSPLIWGDFASDIVNFNGKVGIGTTTPSSALEVNGRIEMATWTADGDTAVYKDDATGAIGVQASDVRLKKNLTPVTDALTKIAGIKTYLFNTLDDNDGAKKRLGVLAQDVKEVLPEATFTFTGTDGVEYYGVHYDKLGALAIAGLQEQQQEITNLSARPTKSYDLEITSLQKAIDEGALSFVQLKHSVYEIKEATADLQKEMSGAKQEIASLSATLNNLSSNFNLWKDIASASGSASASSIETLIAEQSEATVSALMVDNALTVNGKATAFDLTVLNNLNAGTIQIGGVSGEEINAVEGIRFQTLSQGPVDFMGGKVLIGIDGSITAQKLNLKSKETAKSSAGKAIIRAGQLNTYVISEAVTAESLIFVTPRTTTALPVSVDDQTAGEGFAIRIPEVSATDIEVQWLIIN